MNLNDYDLIVINHSGGKDSQAMLSHLWRKYPDQRHKFIIVHADLGEMEWEPMHDFIQANSFGMKVNIIKPEMSFFDLCRKYKRLPSGQARFCTDQLKTMPINKWLKANHPNKRILNCLGIRAQESTPRSLKPVISKAKGSTIATPITNWFPIFEYSLQDVWDSIAEVGQKPHPVYAKGFSRLSCVFCVLGKIEEHKQAALLKPELAQKMSDLEQELGKTVRLKTIDKVKVQKPMTEYLPGVKARTT